MKSLQMKKIAVSTIAAAAMFASLPSVQAATLSSSNFNVIINLTPTCSVSTQPGDITLNYIDGGAAVNSSTTMGVTCTNGANYQLSLDGAAGLSTYSFTDADTGLPYTMSFTAAGTGGADTATLSGTGAEVSATIGANIAALQSGTCPGGVCTSTNPEIHFVVVNY